MRSTSVNMFLANWRRLPPPPPPRFDKNDIFRGGALPHSESYRAFLLLLLQSANSFPLKSHLHQVMIIIKKKLWHTLARPWSCMICQCSSYVCEFEFICTLQLKFLIDYWAQKDKAWLQISLWSSFCTASTFYRACGTVFWDPEFNFVLVARK